MKVKFLITTGIILLVGILFRLALTGNGNFLFNIDSARDFVDVREMVELGKFRLTGPTTAIDGLYSGPFWYYFLATGYIVSQGDPYSAVLLQIALWAIGGFFLLKLVSRWSSFLLLPIGAIWVASNHIVLANLYAFNPTPVMLLTPLLIYLLVQYLEKGKGIYAISTWFLAGLFFNLEMNFGVFTPIIIFAGVILTKNTRLLKQKEFWMGVGAFILTLLPQVIFDLKHQLIMSRALLKHLSENSGNGLDILNRIQVIAESFFNTFVPTLMNHKLFAGMIVAFSAIMVLGLIRTREKEKSVLISLIFIFVPFLGYLIIPVTVNPWHLGAEMAASLILLAYLLKKLMDGGVISKLLSISLSISIIWFGLANIGNFFLNDSKKPNLDPSLYKNEIAAIDYVYKYADGKNFKVYTYLPSIIDYPYQYLIWLYGLKEFGYLPIDYAYAPEKFEYISNKKSFSATEDDLRIRENSNLVFLIKEPNRNYTRFGWEGDLVKYNWVTIDKQMIGPIEVEIRKE